MKTFFIALAASTTISQGALTLALGGTTAQAEWTALTSTTYAPPTYPSFGNFTDDWGNPIAANSGSDGSAVLDKVSGGGFPSSTSIYSFLAPGTFEIIQSTPLTDLATIIWQIDRTTAFLSAPVLNYNGGSQGLSPDFEFSQAGESSGTGPTGPFSSTLYALQWDLSGVTNSIADYQIIWTGDEHQSIFTMNLDESDSFSQVIPEPSAIFLCLGGMALALRRRRN